MPRNRNVPRSSKSRRRVKRGRKQRISADPPPITARKWNRATVTFETHASSESVWHAITDLNCLDAFAQQTGLPDGFSAGTTPMQYRFSSVRLWQMSSASSGSLSLAPCDLITPGTATNPATLSVRQDYPGKNHYSHVSSSWPAAQRQHVLTSAYPTGSTGTDIFLFAASQNADRILCQFTFSWKVSQTTPAPTQTRLSPRALSVPVAQPEVRVDSADRPSTSASLTHNKRIAALRSELQRIPYGPDPHGAVYRDVCHGDVHKVRKAVSEASYSSRRKAVMDELAQAFAARRSALEGTKPRAESAAPKSQKKKGKASSTARSAAWKAARSQVSGTDRQKRNAAKQAINSSKSSTVSSVSPSDSVSQQVSETSAQVVELLTRLSAMEDQLRFLTKKTATAPQRRASPVVRPLDYNPDTGEYLEFSSRR